jgi:hypothetical protein
MDKSGRRKDRGQTGDAQLRLPLRGLAREALWETVVISANFFSA